MSTCAFCGMFLWATHLAVDDISLRGTVSSVHAPRKLHAIPMISTQDMLLMNSLLHISE